MSYKHILNFFLEWYTTTWENQGIYGQRTCKFNQSEWLIRGEDERITRYTGTVKGTCKYRKPVEYKVLVILRNLSNKI